MKKKMIFPILMLIALVLAGCGTDEEPPPDINALYTAAAETLGAQFTQQALDQPPSTPTPTLEISLVTPTPTFTLLAAAPTATNTQTSGGAPPAFSGCDVADFVADITIPDGMEMAPGTVFTKTWEVKNIGTCTWNENYKVIFYFGQQMAAQSSFKLTSQEVKSGETLQISIQMTAPTQAGEYYSNWRMQNDKGEVFGLGANADAVYAQIKVVTGGTTKTATSQVTATATTGVATNTPTNTSEPPTETPTPTNTETP
jgi:phosphotransferase system HPr-like phosphotransfer protein